VGIPLKTMMDKVGITEKMVTDRVSQGKFRVTTPVFTSSYANVFEPRETPSGDMKYSVSMLFPKSGTDFKQMVLTACAAAAQKFGAPSKWPRALKSPFRDGDEESDEKIYHGCIFVGCGNKNRPGVVDRQMGPITSDEDFYSGCKARASISFFGYDKGGNKGVGTGLNNVLVWEKGDRLDGRVDAIDEFKEFAEDAIKEEKEIAVTGTSDEF